MRRVLLAACVAGLLAGLAAPSLAGTLPVGVTYSTKDGGVSVGTTVNGQPGVGAWVRGGRACVGASYQMPQCVELETDR
ncbi:MAG TPA: hypothetical protein VM097_03770 [Mycobacteriales bacterium]|nr:hypothetical protein [Mycobacteriales bacterium]